jgi:hypothetical protein
MAPLVIPKAAPVPQPEPAKAPPPAPAAAPLPAAAWASIAANPPKAPPPRPAQSSRGPIILAAVLGFAAVVGAVVAGFLLGLIPTGGAAAQRSSRPERVSTPALTATPSSASAPTPTAAGIASTPPPPVSAAVSATPPPPASAPVSAAPPPSAPPPSAAPDVDLSALQPTQGYLYVHSRTATKVFVMGKEVGETNQPIVTSCGTRFVRLGPKLGHFIEPGGAVIIKCGALTEVKR